MVFAKTTNSDIALVIAIVFFAVAVILRFIIQPKTVETAAKICVAIGLAALAFAFLIAP